MLFGIARHTYRELGVVALLDFAVDKFSPVHGLDLAHQVGGVGVSLGVGDEAGFVLPLVAPQCQHVVQPQEIHVDQRILDVVFRPAPADQVGNHLHVVLAPDRGRDADRARTAAHDVPLAASVGADVLFEGFVPSPFRGGSSSKAKRVVRDATAPCMRSVIFIRCYWVSVFRSFLCPCCGVRRSRPVALGRFVRRRNIRRRRRTGRRAPPQV